MKKSFYFTCLSLFLTISFAGSSFAASVPSANSVPARSIAQQQQIEASVLMEQGQYDEAYALYSILLREYPENDRINFGYARAALRSDRLGQAVMAYERLLLAYPNEPILLKELAYALSLQNDPQRSKIELAKNPHSTDAENDDLTKKWTKSQERTQFSGKVSAGFIYDTNVNGGPASEQISIGKWDLNIEGSEAQATPAAFIATQLSAGYRLATASPWWIVGSVSGFARHNTEKSLDELDLSSSEWGSASAGIRYLGTKSMFDVRVRPQVFDYGLAQNIVSIGPTVSFAYALTPNLHTITSAQIDSRTYSTDDDYSGWYGSIGQFLRLFLGEEGHTMTIGGKYLGSNTNADRVTYDGYEFSADFTFVLPYEIRLSPFVSYGAEYHHAPATALEEENRQDRILRTGLNVEIPISESWSVDASYQNLKNFSNSALYEYNQHLTRLGLSWSF